MIDFHTHPLLVREILRKYSDLPRVVRDVYYMRSSPQPLETFLLELEVSGLDRAVLLPFDVSTTKGCRVYSNEQVAELCRMSEQFVGFASVDPHSKTTVDDLQRAIEELGLRGLNLSPPMQAFYPNDAELLYPIYERAQKIGIPIVFHAGMTWTPQSKAKYGQPIFLEDVAYDFPKLNIVIAHFAWPWVLEAVMLALKYPNVYIDTACLYFDNPTDFLHFVMTQQVPLSAIENSLRHKIVFGSDYPRVEIKNAARAVRSLGLSQGCLDLIFEGNARKLLGEVA
jgi:uncharacterized protein